MLVLVDMDGVLFNWNEKFDEVLNTMGSRASHIPRTKDQKTFDLFFDKNRNDQALVWEAMNTPGFYADLKPKYGAVDALNAMQVAGHEVRIVSAPTVTNPTCASDKYNSMIKYFGQYWADRTILTTDKTFIQGDFLIDDKPNITGSAYASWRHIVFDAKWNRDVPGLRINNWNEWKSVLQEAMVMA